MLHRRRCVLQALFFHLVAAPMYLELTEQAYKNRYGEYSKNATIVIDNGTHVCKAGYAGKDPQMCFRNVLYRYKTESSIENFQGASTKTMFDRDVVVNFEILENVIDEILRYLKPPKLTNLIFMEKICSPTHVSLLKFLFEVYRFEKIQVGVDSCYSYTYNLSGEDCMIIDMSHSAVTCIVIKGKGIVDAYKINFGGNAAGEYISSLMSSKFSDNRRNYKGLVPYLRCAANYDREAVEIFEMIKRGDYSKSYFLDEEFKGRTEDFADKKQKRCTTPTQSFTPEVDVGLINTADSELDPEGIKEKRKQKILYHSALYRLKARIEKCLERIKRCITLTEEEYEKLENLDKFIEKKKTEFQELKRELEMRSKLRRDVKNRKTYEFQIKFKEGELTPDERLLVEKIRDAEDLGREDKMLDDLENLMSRIKELDPYFEPYTADTVDILSGHSIGRLSVNVELLKIAEILFSPSIVGLDQMGLSEIMEDVSKKHCVNKVFLTGGFSQIEGIEKRIRDEMTSMSFVGEIEVVRAEDPVNDPFRGAEFSSMFPVYTLEQFDKLGAEGMVNLSKKNFF